MVHPEVASLDAVQLRVCRVWLTPLNWPTVKTPYWVQVSGLYFLCRLSYGQYCVEFFCKFSLPWQQGSVWAKFDLHPQAGQSLKPPNGCKYLGYISYAGWIIANFVLKFANFRYHGNRSWSEQSLTDTLKLADPKTPYCVQLSGLYVLRKAEL